MSDNLSESHRIDMPSDAAGIPAVRERLTEYLRAHGFRPEDIWGVELALGEALLNAIRHGNQDDPARTVRIDYGIANEVFYVRVRDEGPGFDPAEVPDPTQPENLQRAGGRGLLLMRHYMCQVHFLGKGNDVLMCKRRGARLPGAPNRRPKGLS
jgi:serine/threonine-protein kinase RsbW